MRTFKLTINEDELQALIRHHKMHISDTSVETSARIHDLTKRLNKRIDDVEENNNADVERENATEQPKVEGWN